MPSDDLRVRISGERPPRVSVAFDTAAGPRELPFVVGVLADLSGHPQPALPPLGQRKFATIDRDNFDEVLARAKPRLVLNVPDRLLSGDGALAVELRFATLEDFGPGRVAEQVPQLRELKRTRQRLERLRDRPGSDPELERSLRGSQTPAPRPADAPPPAPSAPASGGLLDQILQQTEAQPAPEAPRTGPVDDFVRRLIEEVTPAGQVLSRGLSAAINQSLQDLDRKLAAQLNEILHAPAFQKLEATWRGLAYIVKRTETDGSLKLRVLNASKSDLADADALARRLLEEFDDARGQPFGLLIADFEFGRSDEDVRLLRGLAGVAQAALAPLVASAAPAMFGLKRFADLDEIGTLPPLFKGEEYAAWNEFRDSEEARFVALTVPHMMLRVPYGERGERTDEFPFEEDVANGADDRFLWGSAGWAYAVRVAEAFTDHGWLMRTRGKEAGGRVEGLPVFTCRDEYNEPVLKCPTEITLGHRTESELEALGFLPLVHVRNTDYAIFLESPTVRRVEPPNGPKATAKAWVASRLSTMLCAARFGIPLKMMLAASGPDSRPEAIRQSMNDWLARYVADPQGLAEFARARQPLSAARVEFEPEADNPARYRVTAVLSPHHQTDLAAEVRLPLGHFPS